jgi:hypothetical protein
MKTTVLNLSANPIEEGEVLGAMALDPDLRR